MHRAARRTVALAVAISGPKLIYNHTYSANTLRAKETIIENQTAVEVAPISAQLVTDELFEPEEEKTPVEEVDVVSPVEVFKVKVYGYNGCPFCGKVRSLLDYYGFEYEDVEVHPFTKKELKSVNPGYKKVPVVLFIREDNQQQFVIKGITHCHSIMSHYL